ncbi:hypothetical protein F4780DRAFT_778013 [Xylariomycetidae sp. FL0641]|nr:hypothetical protein F4780DRAFT_778013 [Xylariomycetidae sp. FL0641]
MALKALLVSATLSALVAAAPLTTREPAATSDLSITILEGSADLTATQATSTLQLYHERLGEEGTASLVAADVDAADRFWHSVISSSGGGFVGATTRIRGLVEPARRAAPAAFDAAAVGRWFATGGSGWPNSFLATSPTHHASRSGAGTRDAAAVLETIEGWGEGGGPVTAFAGYAEPAPGFLPALPAAFPPEGRSALALTLRDGTVFAHDLTAVRDLPAGAGVEIFQGIYVPDSTPESVVQGAVEHITVEFANWLRFAYKQAMEG